MAINNKQPTGDCEAQLTWKCLSTHVASQQCLGQPHVRGGWPSSPFWAHPSVFSFPLSPSITSLFLLSSPSLFLFPLPLSAWKWPPSPLGLGSTISVSLPSAIRGGAPAAKSCLVGLYFEPTKCVWWQPIWFFFLETKMFIWIEKGVSCRLHYVRGPIDSGWFRSRVQCTYGRQEASLGALTPGTPVAMCPCLFTHISRGILASKVGHADPVFGL